MFCQRRGCGRLGLRGCSTAPNEDIQGYGMADLGRGGIVALVGLIAAQIAVASPAMAEPARPSDQAEIVVTGERVRRSLHDTASSVAVFGKREIEASSADRIDQILALVPNVTIGNGSQGPAIRGQDTTGALQSLPAFLFGGNRPRTTLIVDGRRDTYNEFVFGVQPLWDVAQVEVFRSPQTTTQGQNSIAGAIFVTTSDPTFKPEASARAIVGALHVRELSALASGPISGDVALRVSGDLRYSRTTSRIADRAQGADPNHDVFGVARAKLLVRPSGMPGSRLELTFAHTQSQAPQVVQLSPPFRARHDQSGFYGTFRVRTDALTLEAHQPLAPALGVNVTLTAGDNDTRRLAFPGLGQSHIKGRDWSAEAVFDWSPAGPLSAIGGTSRTHVALRQSIDLSALSGIGTFHDVQDSFGLFGEATLRLIERASLTAGLRYQQDRQDRVGVLASGLAGLPLDYDRTFHAWLPKLSLAYDFSPAARVGVLVQRAYNPGGATLRFDTGEPDNFEAERLWDYELFARAKLSSAMTASANLFFYDMRDAQRAKSISVLAPGGFSVGFADLFNAPKARSEGAEAQLEWRLDRHLSARLSAGLLRTRLIDAGADYPEFSGNVFARSPRFTLAAAVDWKANERLRLSAQARHHSAYYADDVNSPVVSIKPATVVDARAEYELGRVKAFAYARNLFDTFALIDRFDSESATAEDPREIGIGIERAF
jgi:iron complex outermembrane recepter protein